MYEVHGGRTFSLRPAMQPFSYRENDICQPLRGDREISDGLGICVRHEFLRHNQSADRSWEEKRPISGSSLHLIAQQTGIITAEKGVAAAQSFCVRTVEHHSGAAAAILRDEPQLKQLFFICSRVSGVADHILRFYPAIVQYSWLCAARCFSCSTGSCLDEGVHVDFILPVDTNRSLHAEGVRAGMGVGRDDVHGGAVWEIRQFIPNAGNGSAVQGNTVNADQQNPFCTRIQPDRPGLGNPVRL